MRLRDIMTTVATGTLALSMIACTGGGNGSNEGAQVSESESGTQNADAQNGGIQNPGIPMEGGSNVPDTPAASEWEPSTQAAAQFLTDDEKRVFDEFIGSGNEAIETTMVPVAFIAEQVVDGQPSAYAFVTQNTCDGEITWNVVVVHPREINPETGKPHQNIDFITPDDLYVTEEWKGLDGASEPGWSQHVADMTNAPKLEDQARQQVIDDYFASGIGGSRATFGPVGTRDKDGIKSYIYIVENVTDGGQPVWMFVTLNEDASGNLTVGSCENMDIQLYLGIK